jgi:multiple sugar transport system permease protein
MNELIVDSGNHSRHKSVAKRKKSVGVAPWLFILPGVVFTIWLRYYPICKAFIISLFKYNVMDPPGVFTGLKNYADIFVQKSYWDAWLNTFVFLALTLVITFFIPVLQAIFLSEVARGKSFFSTIYLVTAVIPVSVNVILWKWIWHPDYGIANAILQLLKLPPQLWLSDTSWTKFCIIFPGVIGGGVTVLIYFAAILGISHEIIESAEMDGCTGWKKIRYIVLPNIRFIIFMYFVMTMIFSMQIMVTPFQFTSGGPAGAATSMGIYIYNTAMKDVSYGRSNAASVILFIVVAVMTVFQMKLDKSETA